MFTEAVDFELPGPIPLRWERLWNSTSIHQGPLGHGWHHCYDLALFADAEQQIVALRAADGRGIAFDWVALDEADYNRLEKLSLRRDKRGYAVLDHVAGLSYRFSAQRADGVMPLQAVENANGFAITFAYNAQGHLASIVDSAMRQMHVRCDEHGRVLTITAPHPTEPRQTVDLVAYSYSSRGELTSCRDAMGQSLFYAYKRGLLVKETLKTGLGFYFEYDGGRGPDARCTHTWGDEGIYDHKLAYDVAARRTVVTNSLGHVTTYQGNGNGLVVEQHDARGGVTLIEYNDYNEVLRSTDPLGHATAYEYDEHGNRTVIAQPDGARVELVYDHQGRCTAATDPVGGQWHWTYDEAGNVVSRVNPLGNAEHYVYAHGLLRRLTNSLGHGTEVTYDSAYNVLGVHTSGTGSSRRLYDNWGRPYKIADVRGNVQWREYDLLSRITTLHEPDGNVRRFTYDGFDNVVRVQDRHHDVRYAYRGMGRLIRRVEAGTAVELAYDTEERLRAIINKHGLTYRFELDACGDVVTEAGFDGLTRRYQRDLAGRVVELAQPTGQHTRYSYDPAGRATEVVYGDGTTETFRYRLDGALIQASNDTTAVVFERTVLGAVLQETQGQYSVASEYDASGWRNKVSSSLGAALHYTRNQAGQVEQVRSGNYQTQFERDAQGLEIQRSFSGGVYTRWKRDSLGRPVEQRITSGHSRKPERVRQYTWQENDRLAQVHDSVHGTSRFEHDAFGNLAAATFGDGTRELRLPDAVGNLFRTTARQDRRYGPAGQLLETQGIRYAYDALGNLKLKVMPTGEEWRYNWNAAGLLTEVVRPDGTVVRFSYDALGRRVSKTYRGHTTHWVWDGDTPLHEWTTLELNGRNTDDVVTWLFEESSFTPVAKLHGVHSQSILTDHLGTPLQMHDHEGQQTWAAELNSYGEVRWREGQQETCPFRYQGQYEDDETGLHYNRFRYYDPQAGQYISQDPVKVAGGTNVYAYVHDPTLWLDVYGLSAGHTFPTWMATRQGYQRHHIVPHSLRNHPVMQRAGMNINAATNMTYLPVANGIDPNPNRSLHRGYNEVHTDYNRNMRQQLNDLDGLARRENWQPERLQQEVLRLQHDTRAGLNTGRIRCH